MLASKGAVKSPPTSPKSSRLKASREVQAAPISILNSHKGEQIAVVKFREVESLLERSVGLPVTVTVAELKLAACTLFGYPVERSRDVKLSAPDEGITVYDQV